MRSKLTHTHMHTVTKLHTCAETPRHTHHAFRLSSSVDRYCLRRTRTCTHTCREGDITVRVFLQHQTSILHLLPDRQDNTVPHRDSLPYLAPHPSPLWRRLSLVTQILQVTMGHRAVNELILITVNSTTLESVCGSECVFAHACKWRNWTGLIHGKGRSTHQPQAAIKGL